MKETEIRDIVWNDSNKITTAVRAFCTLSVAVLSAAGTVEPTSTVTRFRCEVNKTVALF
jgi:hypothetical protein